MQTRTFANMAGYDCAAVVPKRCRCSTDSLQQFRLHKHVAIGGAIGSMQEIGFLARSCPKT